MAKAKLGTRVLKTALVLSVAGNVLQSDITLEASASRKFKERVDVCVTAEQLAEIAPAIRANACGPLEEKFESAPGKCTGEHIEGSWVRRVPADECVTGWKAQTEGGLRGVRTYD